MNIVPAQGGNRFAGSVFTRCAGDGWQGSNLTTQLQSRRGGLRVAAEIVQAVGRQRHVRRSDQARQAVVLLDRTAPGNRQQRGRDLRAT